MKIMKDIYGGISPKNYDIIELDAGDLLAKYTHYCQVCRKRFKRDANLRMHMRAYGGEYKTSAALSKLWKHQGELIGQGKRLFDKCEVKEIFMFSRRVQVEPETCQQHPLKVLTTSGCSLLSALVKHKSRFFSFSSSFSGPVMILLSLLQHVLPCTHTLLPRWPLMEKNGGARLAAFNFNKNNYYLQLMCNIFLIQMAHSYSRDRESDRRGGQTIFIPSNLLNSY